ncbi:hypothetical protein PDE01_26140 [Paracoccus denitrificans]|nr:hypothetical protein PDE01_26140 [Paracoccus denitrificans]
MNRARHPHRLVGRAEAAVTADLAGDLGAQAAKTGDIVALGRFGQLPPQMQLLLSGLRDAAALDGQRRRAEMADQMRPLVRDIALVEIDDQCLHLDDMLGAGFATLRHRAGDDIDGSADGRGYLGTARDGRGRTPIGRQPAQITRRRRHNTLFRQAAQRDQTVTPRVDDIEKQRDLRRIDRRHAHCSRPSLGSRSAGWI